MIVSAHRHTLVFVALLFCSACSFWIIAAQSDATAAERSVSGLYETIRRIAFPASPDLQGGDTKADGRFILLMPGKILNFQDYHPGLKYQKDTLVRHQCYIYLVTDHA